MRAPLHTPPVTLSTSQEDLGHCRENRWEAEGRPAVPSARGGAGRMGAGFLCAGRRCGLDCILVRLVGGEGSLTEARVQVSSL